MNRLTRRSALAAFPLGLALGGRRDRCAYGFAAEGASPPADALTDTPGSEACYV